MSFGIRYTNSSTSGSDSNNGVSRRSFLAMGSGLAIVARLLNAGQHTRQEETIEQALSTAKISENVQAAMDLIEQEFGDVKPDQIYDHLGSTLRRVIEEIEQPQYPLKDRMVSHIVAHQVIAFGEDPERVEFLLSQYEFDGNGLPWAPLESHPGHIAAVLVENGVPLEHEFAVEDKRISLSDIISALPRQYSPNTVGIFDPSWIIRSLLFLPNDQALKYVSVGSSAANGGTLRPDHGLSCRGLHYREAVLKVIEKYQGDPRPEAQDLMESYREQLGGSELRTLLSKVGSELADGWRELPDSIDVEEKLANFYHFDTFLNYTSHLLEIVLDSAEIRGYDPNGNAEKEVESRVANDIAIAIVNWYSSEFLRKREMMDKILRPPDGVPLGMVFRSNLLHAYRALNLWTQKDNQNII